MATYATDLNVVNAADADTDWAELSGHTSGAAPSDDTENYMQNSVSVSQATGQATGTSAGMEYNYGSNLGSGWTAGHVFLVWQYYAAPTNINSWANGGMRIGVGSSSGNMNFWNAMGDDFSGSPYACWQNTAIDPSDPAGSTYSNLAYDAIDGSPTTGNYTIFGSLPNVRAKITKGSPHAVDVIRYGRGEIYATGTGANFAGYATANDAETARWGLFQKVRGGYLWKGLFSLGQSGTSITFSDSNKSIFIDDTPRVRPTFNKIEINNSSSSVTWTGISIVGVGTSITGSAAISPGDFETVDSATIDFTSCIFSDMGTFIFDASTNTQEITDSIFRRCGQVTQGGASFDGCTFSNSTAAVSLLVDDPDVVENCTFESDGSNHAIELTTDCAGNSYTLTNLVVSGYASSDGSTGNEVIYNNSGGAVTINIDGGSGVANISVRNGTSASTSLVANFSFTVTGLELNTEVTIVTAGTSTELHHTENATTSDGDGKYQITYSHSGGASVDVLVHHIDYKPDISNQYGITLPSANSSIKVQMFDDENYENPA
jgi:hypothetical protein